MEKENLIGKIIKPTEKFELVYGEDYKSFIEFSPQQKWRVIDVTSKSLDITNDKGIIIELPISYLKYWEDAKKPAKKKGE